MSRHNRGRHSAPPAPAQPKLGSFDARSARAERPRRAGAVSIGSALGVVLLASPFVDPYSGAFAASSEIASVQAPAEVQVQTYRASSGAASLSRTAAGASELPQQETAAASTAAESSAAATTEASASASASSTSDATTSTTTTTTVTIPVSDVQATAREMVLARGWSESDFTCLVSLWNKESHWNYQSYNRSTGAYGIPQALPGSKMASAGSDWQTNPITQVSWGLGYIAGRYGTPCAAWSHSQSTGWY